MDAMQRYTKSQTKNLNFSTVVGMNISRAKSKLTAKPIIITLAILVTIPLSSVYTSSIRHDSGNDATLEESHCWST
jgi:hypothetical protein